MTPLVTLVDGALPRRRFERLRDAVVRLGDAGLRRTYQTTFWFDMNAKPSNLVEDAALHLRSLIPAREIAGVEWWLSRMRTSNVGVDFHVDRDNALFERTGRTTSPNVSSLLYLNRCRGGLLAVTRRRPNPRNPALAPDVHDFDLVEPKPNRFCFFDGRRTHGVLDANGHIPLRRLPREPELRLAIAMNFWRTRPLGVPTFDQGGVYSLLAVPFRREV
ncbi:MAG: hypothetical protein JNG84_13370 [Archangium sp.]|nr:hypothetical protein [Archangium sp.]